MIILQNVTSSMHTTKSIRNTYDSDKSTSPKESNYSTTPIDIFDIKNASLFDTNNHVRVIDAGSGQRAAFVFSEKTSEVSVIFVDKSGVSHVVSNENSPKDLKNIKTLDSFNRFLNNAHTRGAMLSDGQAKLYIMQKGLGGSGKPGGGDLTKPVTGPSQPQAPATIGGGFYVDGFGKGGKPSWGGSIGGKIHF